MRAPAVLQLGSRVLPLTAFELALLGEALFRAAARSVDLSDAFTRRGPAAVVPAQVRRAALSIASFLRGRPFFDLEDRRR